LLVISYLFCSVFFPKQLWTSDTQGDEAEAGEGGEN